MPTEVGIYLSLHVCSCRIPCLVSSIDYIFNGSVNATVSGLKLGIVSKTDLTLVSNTSVTTSANKT
jgi:hypothetical protein